MLYNLIWSYLTVNKPTFSANLQCYFDKKYINRYNFLTMKHQISTLFIILFSILYFLVRMLLEEILLFTVIGFNLSPFFC